MDEGRKSARQNIVGADGCRPDTNMRIKLNEFSLIIKQELKNTDNLRCEIKLDQYIIRLNHLNCIITIQRNIMGEEIVTGGQPASPTIDF